MSKPTTGPKFVASKSDPSRAEAVSDHEFERLIGGLKNVVMPGLSAAAAHLSNAGFSIVKLDRCAGLASLTVQRRKAGVSAWLYFQIHRTFGPLLSSERVFWMYSVNGAYGSPAGRAGRLPDFGDAGLVKAVAVDFVLQCLSASWVKIDTDTGPVGSQSLAGAETA